MRGGRHWLAAQKERLNEDKMVENGAVLTRESFLVVLPHGNKVPQAGVKLLHDGLKSKGRRDLLIINGDNSARINTHEKFMAYHSISLVVHVHTKTFQNSIIIKRMHKPKLHL